MQQDTPRRRVFNNGFPITCPVPHCMTIFPSYNDFITHLADHHPLDSDALRCASETSSNDSSQIHPRSGYRIHGERLPNSFEAFDNDKYADERRANPFWPFRDDEEAELAEWLNEELTSTQIDQFLKLAYTRRNPPSFRTCHSLRSWIEILPAGPAWHHAEIKLDGYGTIANNGPISLIYRDGLEALKYLFGNPIWAHYCSPELHANHTAYNQRIFSEFNTGCLAWDMQDQLPEGATIVPIHFGSDKLSVTSNTGDLEMHPLLMTLACIPAAIRSKLSNNAWICIGYLPVPKFCVHPTYNSILVNRVLHEAMDIITAPLKCAAHLGANMADGFGNVRLVFPPVVALSGDLIEHRDMSALGGSVSPVSMATTEQFGDGQAYPPRTKAHTLNTIYEIAQKFDPWELHDFQRECTKHGLNGVHKPWWRDYALTDPSIFCVPDLLHTVYKFFWDHLVKAAQIAVGTTELDRRFATLHRRIGHPHLRRVSEAKQMTGRMYREIMRTMIVVLHGAVTPGFMRAMRSILDYFLLAQSPRHTPHSLARMTLYLRKFHENKQAIMDAGGRGTLGHWQIPKLELLVNMVPSILSSGALPQWSCDRVERLLRTEAKFPFTSRSNRQRIGHGAQCAQHLDRVEKMRLFCLYTLFRSHGVELIDRLPDPAALESSEVADDDGASGVVETATVVDSFDVTRSWVLRALPETDAERYLHGPRPTHNLFVTGTISVASEVAFHINRKPDAVLRIDEAATIYQIADFRAALADYVHGLDLDSRGGSRQHLGLHNNISFDSVRAWQKYRIQLRSVQTPGLYMDPETLMAFPPGSDHPLGMCDTVLVDSLRADGQPRSCGALVVQVRIVFEPVPRKNATLPPHLLTPLVYAQAFEFADTNGAGHPVVAPDISPLVYAQAFEFADTNGAGHPVVAPDILMYRLRRSCYRDAANVVHRSGEVFPLANIVRPVDLAPVHEGHAMEQSYDTTTVLEIPEHFWLNDMWDREIHDAIFTHYG